MPDDRLDGWKAIGNFLGRDRTTAIRWAKERRLPVHRVPGGRTGTVYALRSELEAWLASEPVTEEDSDAPATPGPDDATHTPEKRRWVRSASIALAAFVVGALIAAWWQFGRMADADKAPVSIAAVSSSTANAETAEFARALTADLARFAGGSANLAVFEREPGAKPDTQYAVRTEIERASGKIIAQARLIAVQNGEVLWSHRFEQSELPCRRCATGLRRTSSACSSAASARSTMNAPRRGPRTSRC